MNDGYIAILDSGIGGISVLLELIKLLPNERYLYFGDNHNAPYGNKSLSQLLRITEKNIDYIKQYKIKALIFACNTLSVTILDKIKEYAKVPVFGVFPPVETAVMNGGNVLLLSTCRTAEKFKNNAKFTALGLRDLANEIENNCFSLDEFDFLCGLTDLERKIIYKKPYETVVLGCTHYFFIKNKIFDHLKPQKILGGENFTAKKVFDFIKSQKTLVKNKGFEVFFVGKNQERNKKFFEKVVKLY